MYTYYGAWIGLLAATALLAKQYSSASSSSSSSSSTSTSDEDATFNKFRLNYITVYLFMMAADWFQGPYMYALYTQYGYAIDKIGRLFILGFASSMISGPIVGAAADKL
jgi:hypothetical protein